jgi:hypothetical protein
MKRSLGFWLVLGLLAPSPVYAQSSGTSLSELVPDLILNRIRTAGAPGSPGFPHVGHFTLGDPTTGSSQPGSVPDSASIAAVLAFGDRLRAQFGNVPLGSSTGGFTYSFDESSGVYTRNSNSFGPAFTERAATIGRKKLSVGFNYLHTSFDTFGGEDLRDRSIVFYLPHTDCCPPRGEGVEPQLPGFEGDIVEAALDLQATTDTVALFANYGVTDRLDVGLAVPITRVDLEADVRATIIRLATASTPLVHTFTDGVDDIEETFLSTGSASGIGDIVLRTKYNILPAGLGNTGLSVAMDLRLPTGDEEELLGIGTTQGKFFLILSSERERISPHVNVGFTLSGTGEKLPGIEPSGVSDEFVYAGGVEFVANPKLTILADFLGRTLIDAGNLELEARQFQFRNSAGVLQPPSTTNPLTGQPYEQLALREGNLSVLLGSTGFKFNPTGNLLVGANVLFPLNSAGLTDHLTFAFGLDYAF